MKSLSFYILSLSFISATAQWTTNSNGLYTSQKVGINTTSPKASLEIVSTVNGKSLSLYGNNRDIDFYMGHSNYSYGYYLRYAGTKSGNENSLELWTNNLEGTDILSYKIKQTGNISFYQKVGIGTEDTGSHKLAIEGSVGAREVVVEGDGWSDFVFEENYELPTLDSVQSYITKNGHLKDIPSAKDIKNNGIPLGKMDSKLLQKIEELTLYILELNKNLKKQEKEIESLKIENNNIQNLISKN
ncbi:hypothetical protein [Cellulophaga baltica]|uniref:Uncharacterized protein n=1 Tax=Cellulophaga baltica TaxID=76594 RepID=A0A1G7K136_9FLAO|nr:hypothetical protein [Cellulophaga baltica]SDF30998.1 hypothetical protein SAMN04487992_11139 [Cellulophaga baltica]